MLVLKMIRCILTFSSLRLILCTTSFKEILCSARITFVFCMDLRTNSDYFSIQRYNIGLYNRGRECLLRGTDWVFKSNRYSFVLKGLICLNL